jgi:hypothetical protein
MTDRLLTDAPDPGFRIEERTAGFMTLTADRPFRAGERLFDLSHAARQPSPDYASIDLHDGHVVHPTARYMNHSCAPSAYVDLDRCWIVALRDIAAGEEINFDYLRTERRIIAPFDCHCGAPHCIGRVGTPPQHEVAAG